MLLPSAYDGAEVALLTVELKGPTAQHTLIVVTLSFVPMVAAFVMGTMSITTVVVD